MILSSPSGSVGNVFEVQMKMMNEATRAVVREHREDDVRQVALRGTKDPEVDLGFALQQIDGRRRAQ